MAIGACLVLGAEIGYRRDPRLFGVAIMGSAVVVVLSASAAWFSMFFVPVPGGSAGALEIVGLPLIILIAGGPTDGRNNRGAWPGRIVRARFYEGPALTDPPPVRCRDTDLGVPLCHSRVRRFLGWAVVVPALLAAALAVNLVLATSGLSRAIV